MAAKYDKLNSKHVLVFGGTSGIGYCVAEAALTAGARVTVSGSSDKTTEAAVESLRANFSGVIAGVACELSTADDLELRLSKVFEQVGTVDHVVYTSGDVHHPQKLDQVTYGSILACGQVRFIAALLMVKTAQKFLSASPLSSVTLTNGYVFERPVASWVPEIAWSGALNSVVKALALEMKPIRVNLVSVGVVDTPLLSTSFGDKRPWIKQDQEKRSLTGQLGRPEDVAETYLSIMKNSNMTGSTSFSDAGIRLV